MLDGWTNVWSCERHVDELPWSKRLAPRGSRPSELRLARVWVCSQSQGVQERL